jgi:hypothetical protein
MVSGFYWKHLLELTMQHVNTKSARTVQLCVSPSPNFLKIVKLYIWNDYFIKLLVIFKWIVTYIQINISIWVKYPFLKCVSLSIFPKNFKMFCLKYSCLHDKIIKSMFNYPCLVIIVINQEALLQVSLINFISRS